FDFGIDNLIGFDLHNKKVGIIGLGRIGQAFAKIMHGFGCYLLVNDLHHDTKMAFELDFMYVSLKELSEQSDIISIHVPLNESTEKLINAERLNSMKSGVILINTSRGKVVDTAALIEALEDKKIASAGLDVYENERCYYSKDCSAGEIEDAQLKKLIEMENVLLTCHQAFLTNEALSNIASTTYKNILDWQMSGMSKNEIN
ncbi:UNVERIFIED_CONTAM: hypothetical protein GTU68_014105, partial [Idotea baltica]|nr:hypothetical protein [Idotea baltica]